MTTSVDVWRSVVLGATRRGRVGVKETANALLATGNADVWQGLLIALGDSAVRLPDAAIIAALQAGPPRSALACWHLASGDTGTLSNEIRAALGASPSEAGTTSPICDVVRRLAKPGADRAALLKTVEGNPPAGMSSRLRRQVVPEIPHGRSPHAFSSVRLATEYVAGAVADAATVAGCRWPRSAALVAGDLTFDRHGRPVKGNVGTAGLPDGCAAVAKALLLTHLAPRQHAPVPESRELVVLPFNKVGMECLSREEWLMDPIQPLTFRRGGDVILKKTADMPPTYPDASRLAREQGVVSIEATVSRTGCVQAAAVVNGITPHLDAAAILAVSQWQFTPPTLDGTQIPLAFTASVEFTLR